MGVLYLAATLHFAFIVYGADACIILHDMRRASPYLLGYYLVSPIFASVTLRPYTSSTLQRAAGRCWRYTRCHADKTLAAALYRCLAGGAVGVAGSAWRANATRHLRLRVPPFPCGVCIAAQRLLLFILGDFGLLLPSLSAACLAFYSLHLATLTLPLFTLPLSAATACGAFSLMPVSSKRRSAVDMP
jgi:hypothetical protein